MRKCVCLINSPVTDDCLSLPLISNENGTSDLSIKTGDEKRLGAQFDDESKMCPNPQCLNPQARLSSTPAATLALNTRNRDGWIKKRKFEQNFCQSSEIRPLVHLNSGIFPEWGLVFGMFFENLRLAADFEVAAAILVINVLQSIFS